MKPNNVTALSLAVFGILAAAYALAVSLNNRVTRSYEAEVSIHATLNAVRSLQINIRALQSERANLRPITREWEESRLAFDQALQTLNRRLRDSSLDLPQFMRMANTWGRMESLHVKVRGSMDALDRSGLVNRAANSSLVVKYQELLAREKGSNMELAELSLLLFYLEHADRMVLEIETELQSLEHDLRVQTTSKIRASQFAAFAVLLASILIIGGLLLRISRLYASLAADNAARRLAEQAVRISETDLRVTLNAIGDAVISADAQGGISRMNPAAEKLLHIELTEAMGHQLTDYCRMLHPETKASTPDPVTLALRGREGDTKGSFILVQKDGSERGVTAVTTRMGDTGGVVLVLHDMTEQKRMEEQIRRSQRIESLGQLAGGVAHDFNNLLQVIKANLCFIQESCKLSEEEKEYFKQVEEATGRATELTRQLLALGRRQTMRFRELDPRVLVREFLTLIRRVLGEHIEIDFESAEDVDMIRGDSGQLEQVILNLCVNARDAMPTGGKLRIDLRNQMISAAEAEAWPLARPGSFVRLAITDTGHGMNAATLARLFEPFFTTKAQGKGTGLGLSVVQGIVQQHNGIIKIESKPSQGTTIAVYLPSQDESGPEQTPVPGRRADADENGHNELVLLVEDETPVRLVGTAILRRNGYRVISAADGEEACRLAEDNKDELAVAILDVVMPRMGGVDAARTIQQIKPGLPIVLCTGYAGGVSLPELNKESGWRLITKPYSNRDLLTQVRQAIDSAEKTGA